MVNQGVRDSTGAETRPIFFRLFSNKQFQELFTLKIK